MPLTRSEAAMLSAIVAVGAWLRFAALGHDLPFAPGVDEPEIVERAVRMMRTGDYHPHFFDYPGLYIYLQSLVASLRYDVGELQGLWSNVEEAQPTQFYLWGRAVTATFGTATIVITYFIARRFGVIAAVCAAVLLATQSMHVRESHYVLTDVPMTFFVTLTLLMTIRAVERGTVLAYLGAGVAAGLAAATKYNGGVAIVMPLLALAIARPRHLAWTLAAIAGGAAITFAAAAPYTLIDYPAFSRAFRALHRIYAASTPPPEAPWITYLKHLRNNLAWPAAVLAVAGMTAALVRTWRATTAERLTWALTAGFVAIWFWFIVRYQLVYGRYLLPMLPAVFVLIGGLIWRMSTLAGRRMHGPGVRWIAATVLVIVAAAQPAIRTVEWVRGISKVSTRAQAYAWLLENIPPGAKVAIETRNLVLPPDRFNSVNEPRLITRDLASYVDEGFQYFVASSDAFGQSLYGRRGDATTIAYRQFFRQLELVTSFNPSADHPGPELRIYRVIS